MKKRVIVIGGGAAGLMAAIQGARRGAAVTILDHGKKNGRKILATGNGRCNLTNAFMDVSCFGCKDKSFVKRVLETFTLSNTLEFFDNLGLCPTNKEGYFYPHSEQAAAVLELLMLEAKYYKIKIKNMTEIQGIDGKDGLFRIHTKGWTYEGECVILATGSPASNIKEASAGGYQLARSLGHTINKVLPALVPLICEDAASMKWAGVRIDGCATLVLDGIEAGSSRGELQLTEYGVSGIPVFQLSSLAVQALERGQHTQLLIDFLPEATKEELTKLLKQRKAHCPYKTQRELLIGLFPEKLTEALKGEAVVEHIKNYCLTVTGSKGLSAAQVCSGGIALDQINPATMESKLHKGLYFAGEILDVDGICGGYNLQWAWSSGAIAGMHAAGE